MIVTRLLICLGVFIVIANILLPGYGFAQTRSEGEPFNEVVYSEGGSYLNPDEPRPDDPSSHPGAIAACLMALKNAEEACRRRPNCVPVPGPNLPYVTYESDKGGALIACWWSVGCACVTRYLNYNPR